MAMRSERRSSESRHARRSAGDPYPSAGSTGMSTRMDDMGLEEDGEKPKSPKKGQPGSMAEVQVQYGKSGKVVSEDSGELVRNKSILTRSSSKLAKSAVSMSFRKKSAGKESPDSSMRESELGRSQSMMRATSMMRGGKTQTLTLIVKRSLGNRIGIQLNARNRIASVDKGTPADLAGLHVLDLVVSVDGKSTENSEKGLANLIDPNSTQIRIVVERPPKSQHKAIIAEDNEYEKQMTQEQKGADTAAASSEEAFKPPTATTQSLLAAGFAVKKAGDV